MRAPVVLRGENVVLDKIEDALKKAGLTREWDKYPTQALQMAKLYYDRESLRARNLFDTPGEPQHDFPADPPPEALRARMPDGSWNDLSDPAMGMAGSRFGRNFPLDGLEAEQPPRLFTPSPRVVARELLQRDVFKPATTLNTLAAAWIQFENHNWFFHGRGEPDDLIEVPLAADDPWPEHPMTIRRTPELARPEGMRCPVFRNEETHWWDASQVYGSGDDKQAAMRTFEDGKLQIGADRRLLENSEYAGIDHTGMFQNYWTGVSLLHTLFTLEHNALCDALKKAYPDLGDQRLFELGWLAISALIAKIHLVEWTPGILSHPATAWGLVNTWWGLTGEEAYQRFGNARPVNSDFISGQAGGKHDHFGVPFQFTEEFVSVYRMHALIPDEWKFYSLKTGDMIKEVEFTEIQGKYTRGFMDEFSMPDLFYSFGVQHPGAICLKNYPKTLMNFERIDGELTDLATLDVVRDRERGVPRYTKFRKGLRMPVPKTFGDITSNKQWARQMQEVYDNKIDDVDPIVGMYAEDIIPGQGFSDTATRIFLLMAARRVNSDRFLTTDMRPEVYTQVGYDWVQKTTMTDILLRHYPELAPALSGVANPFGPWNAVR